MAKIPMGNFGQSMPQVERISMPQNQSGQMIANALGNVSQAANQFHDKYDAAQREQEVSAKRLELYHNDVAEKEAKVKLDDVLTTEMSDQVTIIKNDLVNGTINAQQANEKLKTWSSDRYKQLETDMPLHAQKQLQEYWDSNSNQQATSFLPLQLRADVQKGSTIADQAFDVSTRQDREAGRQYLIKNLDGLNLSVADKADRMNKYDTTRDIMDIDKRTLTAVETEDPADLHTLLTELRGGQFKYLDGPTIQDKEKQVLSRISALDQKAQVEENKRVTQSNKVFNEFKTQVLTGRALDSNYMESVGTAVKGTDNEAEYQFYKKNSLNFQNFSRKSTSEQLALINKQKANMKNTTTDNAENESKVMNVYETIYKDKLEVLKNNPTQAVSEAGLKTNSISAVELKTNPSQSAKSIVDNGISQLALRDPNIKLKPISQEDLPEAKQAFDGMGVNAKLNFIGDLIQQSKDIPSGNKIWGATLGQLGGGDQLYVMAGLAKSKNRHIGNEYLSDALINGNHLITKGGFVIPTDLESEFRSKYGNLGSFGNFDNDFKSFKSAYASIANKNGVSHAKKEDIPDKEIVKKAFELSTGGVYDQKAGSWFSGFKTSDGGSFKSWKVPKPYGMSDERFEANLEAGYRGLAKLSGNSVDELKDFRLVPRIDPKSNSIMYDLINMKGEKLRNNKGLVQFIIFNGVSR